MVVIRHYAPTAEGPVYLQKAVLSTLAVSNSHTDTVRWIVSNLNCADSKIMTSPKTKREALWFSF